MTSNQRIRILIADDQASCLQAMQLVLDESTNIDICGHAYDGNELVQLTGALMPDVVITDINMPVIDGIVATRIIRGLHPDVKVLALTQLDEEALIVEMIQANAHGYLYKNARRKEILTAIETVMKGHPFFCETTNHRLQHILRERITRPQVPILPEDFFGPHERDTLLLICRGFNSQQIANTLFLSVNTINQYRSKLYAKAQTDSIAGLVGFAVQYGIFDPWDKPGPA